MGVEGDPEGRVQVSGRPPIALINSRWGQFFDRLGRPYFGNIEVAIAVECQSTCDLACGGKHPQVRSCGRVLMDGAVVKIGDVEIASTIEGKSTRVVHSC